MHDVGPRRTPRAQRCATIRGTAPCRDSSRRHKGGFVPKLLAGSAVQLSFQKRFDAIRAPSAIAAIFAHTTSGSTAAWPTQVP